MEEETETRIIPVIGSIITLVLSLAVPKYNIPVGVVSGIGTVSAYVVFLSVRIQRNEKYITTMI